MSHVTKEQLDCIASVLVKSDKTLYTKTAVNRAISSALFGRVGWACSFGYIANLRNGVQLDKTSVMLRAKIDQLYNMICKPPKPKPLDTEIAKRTLVIHATTHELHVIQERYEKPRDRAIKLLEVK